MTIKKLTFKQKLLVAGTLFGMFFGAGNLIFPVHLGQMAGSNVWPAIVGFIITAVGIPIFGVAAIGITHSDGLQALSSKVGKGYGIFFTCLLYLTIGPLFAIPRCATVSFTTGVTPMLGDGSKEGLALLIFSAIEKNLLVGPVKELLAFNLKQVGEFLTRAMPVMLNEGLWAIGMLMLNRIYANMGYEYYAGMTIFKTFSELAFAFFVGLGNACVIMVGKSIGQGKIERGVTDARRFSVLVPMMGLLIGVTMVLLRHPLVALFATGDNLSATTISTAYAVTLFCSLEYWFRNISYVQVVGVFRSGGDTLTGMLFDLCSLWFVSIPLALLASRVLHFSFIGVVMCAYLGEDIPKSILCMFHFKSMRWLKPVTEEGRAGLKDYRGA